MSDILHDNTKSASLTRLIKLISMSTSSHDHEALAALRMANREAAKFGTWHEILSGKVRVIGDPFASVEIPTTANRAPSNGFTRPAPPPPPPPIRPARTIPTCIDCGVTLTTVQSTRCSVCYNIYAKPKPASRPTPPDPWATTQGRAQPQAPNVKHTTVNKFAGLCMHCNLRVDVGSGEALKVDRNGKEKWLTQHRLDDKTCTEYARRNGKLNNLKDFAAGLGL